MTFRFMLVAIVLLILASFGGEIARFSTQETVTVTVTGKERVTSSDSDGHVTSKYLVFTDKETFENTDSILAMKWNSSDFYGKIREGQICEFRVTGWRIAFFSMYRNIIKMDCK